MTAVELVDHWHQPKIFLFLEICFLFMIPNPKVEFYFQLEASKSLLEISRFRNRVFKGMKYFYVHTGGCFSHLL